MLLSSNNISCLFNYSNDSTEKARRDFEYSLKIIEFCQKQGVKYENINNTLFNPSNPNEGKDDDLNFNVSKEEKGYFHYFFYYKLNQIPILEIDDFLYYHLNITYSGDLANFKRFLQLLNREFEGQIKEKTIKTVLEWMELVSQKENNQSVLSIKDFKKLRWRGHPLELINGFKYLTEEICPTKNMYYCYIENIEGFVYSNSLLSGKK